MKLTIATCQFPTGNDIADNLCYVLRQMRHAKEAGAHVAHFAETCLSGYAGFEVKSSRDYDWSAIDAAMQRVADAFLKVEDQIESLREYEAAQDESTGDATQRTLGEARRAAASYGRVKGR